MTEVVCKLLEKDIYNTTLNIGSNEGHTVNDIIIHLKEIVKEEVKVEYVASRKADVANMILNIEELKKYILFEPTSLKFGLNRFYTEIKESLK